MKRAERIAAALLWAVALMLTAAAAPAQDGTAPSPWHNWRADGTYVLTTDDLRSIQTYYRDVGVGTLYLATSDDVERMREHCLALGENWRPLGHVRVPARRRDRDHYRLQLCYYDAPNPEHVARAKCGNLGMRLVENRPHLREIVCGRPEYGAALG